MKQTFKIFGILILSIILMNCKNSEEKNTEVLVSEVDNAEENKCIDTVIATDATLGKIRNEATIIFSLSEAIDNYVFGIKLVDFKSCPGAFIAAFEDHIEAWSAIKEITDNYPYLRGEMHEVFDQLETKEDGERFKELLANIWSTWEKVERAMSQF